MCDGDVEVRKAARDELLKGAHCIKIMTIWVWSQRCEAPEHAQPLEPDILCMDESSVQGPRGSV